MQTTQYLYNCDPIEFANLSYKDALEFKALAAKRLIKELYQVHYLERDQAYLSDVINAENHNLNLLKEIQISEKETNDRTENTVKDN